MPSLLDVAGDIRPPSFAWRAPGSWDDAVNAIYAPAAASWNQVMQDMSRLSAPLGPALETRPVQVPAERQDSMWTYLLLGGVALALVVFLRKDDYDDDDD
jgi:hypothetical protein